MSRIVQVSVFIVIFTVSIVFMASFIEGRGREKQIGKIILVAGCIGAIIYKTLLFRHVSSEVRYNLMPFWSYKAAFAGNTGLAEEIILNILLYVPLGFVLRSFSPKNKLWQCVLISFLISLSTEIMQLVLRLGLYEIDDIINNTLGGMLGAILYREMSIRSVSLLNFAKKTQVIFKKTKKTT